jgi:hypothetical protein
MSLENWASNRWLEKLGSDREEIERLLANADGHLDDYPSTTARSRLWSFRSIRRESSSPGSMPCAESEIRAPMTTTGLWLRARLISRAN